MRILFPTVPSSQILNGGLSVNFGLVPHTKKAGGGGGVVGGEGEREKQNKKKKERESCAAAGGVWKGEDLRKGDSAGRGEAREPLQLQRRKRRWWSE